MKTENINYLLGNKLIVKEVEDFFNFKNYAKKIQELIQINSNDFEPITFGIYGKWGERKISLGITIMIFMEPYLMKIMNILKN